VRRARTLLGTLALLGCGAGAGPAYRDAGRSIDDRLDDLLGRMTVEEKFWQLFMVAGDGEHRPAQYPHGAFGLQVRHFPGLADAGTASDTTRVVAERINELQSHFVRDTRLGIPALFFEEALHGLIQPGATAFPQAIGLAATFDTALMGEVATAIARETRERGIRMVLSPVVNLATDARWGRTEETYGEDPWLAAAMGLAYVSPFEHAGVVTTPKHFVANVGDGGRDSYPIALSPRTLAETHFVPFRTLIERGGARSVMAAYNSVDGSPASASGWLLGDVLKQRWRFPGFVIADAGGTGGSVVLHGTAPDYAAAARDALEAGLDVIFQTSAAQAGLFWPAFRDGRIDPHRLDDAVRRVLRVKLELGLFERPFVEIDSATWPPPGHAALARRAAEAAIVLLANRAGTLPLAPTIGRLAVIGDDAAEPRLGGYSRPGGGGRSILDGLRRALPSSRIRYEPGPGRADLPLVPIPTEQLRPGTDGAETGLRAEYFDGIELDRPPAVERIDPMVDFTWTLTPPDSSLSKDWFAVRWTGWLVAPWSETVRLGVRGSDGYRLYLDDRLLLDTWRKQTGGVRTAPVPLRSGERRRLRLEYHETAGDARVALVWGRPERDARANAIGRAAAAARGQDAAVVVVGVEEGEFADRASLALPGMQEELIAAVAGTGTPTAVVIVGGSPVTMPWLEGVGAVLMAWYPGEAGGDAVAAALTGAIDPGGRLPIAFPRSVGQLPLSYRHLPTGRGDDYRDSSGKPLFPFGHGLSYTSFAYQDLEIVPATIRPGDSVTVSFQVRNVGARAGDEVAQVYLRDELASVARPITQLVGAERLRLGAGETRQVRVTIGPEALAVLGADLRPVVEPGGFRIVAGSSSADLRLVGRFEVR